MASKKKRHASRSSSRSSSRERSKERKHSSDKKPKKKRKRSSSESSTESESDSSSTSRSRGSSPTKHESRKKHNKSKKRKEKKKKKKSKKKLKKDKQKMKRTSKEMQSTEKAKPLKPKKAESEDDMDRLLQDRAKAMAPMTKEEWEKRQSIVRRVYDEETGRYRTKETPEIQWQVIVCKLIPLQIGNMFQRKEAADISIAEMQVIDGTSKKKCSVQAT